MCRGSRPLLRWQAESLAQRSETRVSTQHRHLRLHQLEWDTLRLGNGHSLQRVKRTVFVPKGGIDHHL